MAASTSIEHVPAQRRTSAAVDIRGIIEISSPHVTKLYPELIGRSDTPSPFLQVTRLSILLQETGTYDIIGSTKPQKMIFLSETAVMAYNKNKQSFANARLTILRTERITIWKVIVICVAKVVVSSLEKRRDVPNADLPNMATTKFIHIERQWYKTSNSHVFKMITCMQ